MCLRTIPCDDGFQRAPYALWAAASVEQGPIPAAVRYDRFQVVMICARWCGPGMGFFRLRAGK